MSVITGRNIERFRLSVIEKGLSLEVRTGMGHSRNSNVLAARQLLAHHGKHVPRTKAKLLTAFTELKTTLLAELDRLDTQRDAKLPIGSGGSD